MSNLRQVDNNIKFYTITHPQKRIWYIEKIYPDTSLHNIGGAVRIKGSVNFKYLEEAINVFIKKNEGLRLQFNENHNEVRQYVKEFQKEKIDFIDFSIYENSEDEFNKWVQQESQKTFLLEENALFFFALFKINKNDNGYFVKFHHIIADGWSMNIMTEEISNIYMKLMNREFVNEEVQYSYLEYIEQEQKYLTSKRFIQNQKFWNERFRDVQEHCLNRTSDGTVGNRVIFHLEQHKSQQIKNFIYENKYSLNTFFVSLFLIYLSKIKQQSDIVIGTPVLNRSGKKQKRMVGMFTSTMPFRMNVKSDYSILEFISKVNEQLKKYYFNQKYPYDLLLKELELKKKGYDNLFEICVNYYNTRLNTQLNGAAIDNIEFYNGNQYYPLQIVIKEWLNTGCLTLYFDYKVDDYMKQQIEDMYNHLNNLMEQIFINPEAKVSKLCFLSERETEKLIYQFNSTQADYPKDKVVFQLFEEMVERVPNKIAVSFENEELTYRKLNEKANQLARFLVVNGVEEEIIVGIMAKHSIETIIGILAILKAGGAYMPIDPDYPVDRINYMLKDSRTSILLTNYTIDDKISFLGDIINLNDQKLYTGEASNLETINKPNDLVYVIYTSGSTGEPKGVLVENKGLVNYIWWAKQMYVKDENEVFPLYSSLAFDLTVTSIFIPLISGNKVAVYSDDRDEYVLNRIMKENKTTVIKLTPSHLSLLKYMDNKNSSVKRLIVGGEDLKTSLAKSIYKNFKGNIEIFNEYGPTETIVGCMLYKYDFEKNIRTAVPIGIPAHNVQVYILNKELDPVPIGNIGEIYISGDGVARGYLNELKLTKERFIENPFIKGKRMYKTGDLAKFLNDGNIEYLGRIDEQIKIRGYRIELGEIQNYLLKHEAIKDTVVINFEDKNMNKYICAYFVKNAQISVSKLREYLLKFLPDYMVPLHFIELDEIPLTLNGKVNKALLPKPQLPVNTHSNFITATNENEGRLIDVVGEVFNIKKVSINENFYHIGGDSIKAIQIASKLNDRGFKIKVKDILSHPVIKEMALCIKQCERTIINQTLCEGSIKPTPIVSWFFSENFTNPNHYNQSVLLELKHDIEAEKIKIIMSELIRHHDSLRINFNSLTGELYYNNEHLNKSYNIEEHDFSSYQSSEQCIKISQVGDMLKASFNIKNDILIKSCIFNLGRQGKLLLLTAHHLVVDGISWRILLEDIYTMLKQICNGQKVKLPEKTHSFQKWAELLELYSNKKVYNEQKYWEAVLRQNFSFYTDYNIAKNINKDSHTISVQIIKEETVKLMSTANLIYNTEPKELLICALIIAIKEFNGSEKIVIELEGHGREDILDGIDVTRTVGWFTSIYPVNINIKANDLSSQIKEIKEQLRLIPNNGVGFGVLKYLSKALKDNDQRHIRFNFLGDFSTNYNNEFFELLNQGYGNESSKRNHLTSLLDINCYIVNEKLNILLTYSKSMFTENTIENFISLYTDNIKRLITHCNDKEIVEFTPSDFDTVEITQEELDKLFT